MRFMRELSVKIFIIFIFTFIIIIRNAFIIFIMLISWFPVIGGCWSLKAIQNLIISRFFHLDVVISWFIFIDYYWLFPSFLIDLVFKSLYKINN